MATVLTWSQRAGRFALALSAVVGVCAACGGGAASAGASPTSSVSTAAPSPTAPPPSVAASPSDIGSPPAELVVGGDRPVRVYVPASYDSNEPAPLLILLHGFTASGVEVDSYFGIGSAADARGFVYAHPDGTLDDDWNRFWNATEACCNFGGSDVDDVAYLTDVIDEIQSKLSIDPKRIAVAGHSNGGFMSYRDRKSVV